MIKINDKVAFKASVIRQCGYDKSVADRRGIVLGINGKIATVDFLGSFNSDDGRTIRSVPIANLVRVEFIALDASK